MRYPLLFLVGASLVLGACDDDTTGPSIVAPANLIYTLDPSGDPEAPLGVLLEWDPVNDPNLEVYNVYSREDGSNVFDLRGSTTSLSFDDRDIYDAEYHVTAVNTDGVESPPSQSVVIDQALRLEVPDFLVTTSLNSAVYLIWGDNPAVNEPAGFSNYRIYSTSFSLDTGECGATWVLEGTTVSPEFVASLLPNGSSFCFTVTAESIEGWESFESDIVADTPRPDARNVLMLPLGTDASQAGFRFFLDSNGDDQAEPDELGVILDGNSANADFRIFVDGSGTPFIEPVRTDVAVALYSDDPIADLTSIDVAPETGYSAAAIEASPGFGYVFEMPGSDQFARYGALRVTHASDEFVIFDWSYQTDPGNPQLEIHGGQQVVTRRGLVVKGAR